MGAPTPPRCPVCPGFGLGPRIPAGSWGKALVHSPGWGCPRLWLGKFGGLGQRLSPGSNFASQGTCSNA